MVENELALPFFFPFFVAKHLSGGRRTCRTCSYAPGAEWYSRVFTALDRNANYNLLASRGADLVHGCVLNLYLLCGKETRPSDFFHALPA